MRFANHLPSRGLLSRYPSGALPLPNPATTAPGFVSILVGRKEVRGLE